MTPSGLQEAVKLPATTNDLRVRIGQLRRQLADTTAAYRRATASRDSGEAITLLRSRSLLMRELLESQCELLLAIRTEAPER